MEANRYEAIAQSAVQSCNTFWLAWADARRFGSEAGMAVAYCQILNVVNRASDELRSVLRADLTQATTDEQRVAIQGQFVDALRAIAATPQFICDLCNGVA